MLDMRIFHQGSPRLERLSEVTQRVEKSQCRCAGKVQTQLKISLAQGGTVVGSDIGVPRDNVKRTNVPRWTSVPGY